MNSFTDFYLHSTMYLFKHIYDDGTVYISLSFTFHYVSI